MPKTRVTLNRAGLRALLNDPGVVSELRRRAEAVEAAARASAPVETGAYRESIRVEEHRGPTRTTVRVIADSDHALVVEAKTGNLARALDAAGGE